MATCPSCGGDGYDESSPCERCSGDGEVWVPDPDPLNRYEMGVGDWETCPQCNGSGHHKCPECDGTGDV